MLSSKALLGATLAMSCGISFAAETIACPQWHATKTTRAPLVNASVFDGPPEDRADQIPDLSTGEWELGSTQADAEKRGRPYYLVCHYKKTTATVTFKLSYDVKSCQLDVVKGRIAVSCR